MKLYLTKLYCWLFRHDIVTTNINNYSQGGRSSFGTHECLRCGFEKPWQYDI